MSRVSRYNEKAFLLLSFYFSLSILFFRSLPCSYWVNLLNRHNVPWIGLVNSRISWHHAWTIRKGHYSWRICLMIFYNSKLMYSKKWALEQQFIEKPPLKDNKKYIILKLATLDCVRPFITKVQCSVTNWYQGTIVK